MTPTVLILIKIPKSIAAFSCALKNFIKLGACKAFHSCQDTVFYLEMPFPPQARFSIGRTYFLRSNISCTSIVLYLTSAVFHNGTLFLCELKARCKIALGRFCEPKKSRVKCAPAPFHIAPALHNFATEKFIKTPPTYCAKESHRIDRSSFFRPPQ